MKIILVIVMLQLGTGLKLFSQGHEPRAATDFAQLVLSEVNLLRTNPKQYAMLRLKNEYISKTMDPNEMIPKGCERGNGKVQLL